MPEPIVIVDGSPAIDPRRYNRINKWHAQHMTQDTDDSDIATLKRKQLRPLHPTRWTTRAESIQSIIDNYKCVLETLEEIAASDKSEGGTKANGLAAVMQSFGFYFSLLLCCYCFLQN